MIKVENIDVWGFEHAIRGMRNPLNSWSKIDSCMELILRHDKEHAKVECIVGENDLSLMKRLYKGGSEHRKYLRQIMVSMDITAPLYWWKEFDTYKVGTVANSCSTMHTIHKKEFEIEDFSCEHLDEQSEGLLNSIITLLNFNRERFLEAEDKKYWWQLIQLLPSSYNQKRTVTMNYENVVTMIKQRSGHKLDEWRNLLLWLEKELPYIEKIMED